MPKQPRPPVPRLDEYYRLIGRMTADPDLHGDLLLLGILMAERLVFGPEGSLDMGEIAAKVQGPRPNRHMFMRLLRSDIRRYDPQADPDNARRSHSVPCQAPMIRREGVCGKRASTAGLLTELETGRRLWGGGCRRHREWWYQYQRDNQIAVKELGSRLPTPAANAGGILARHLPRIDWPDYWRKLDPSWVEPPEVDPHIPPTFRLLLGECEQGDEPAPEPPALRLIRGDKPDPPAPPADLA